MKSSVLHYTRDNSVYTSMKSLSWYISSYTSMAELSWVILSYTCVRIPDVSYDIIGFDYDIIVHIIS